MDEEQLSTSFKWSFPTSPHFIKEIIIGIILVICLGIPIHVATECPHVNTGSADIFEEDNDQSESTEETINDESVRHHRFRDARHTASDLSLATSGATERDGTVAAHRPGTAPSFSRPFKMAPHIRPPEVPSDEGSIGPSNVKTGGVRVGVGSSSLGRREGGTREFIPPEASFSDMDYRSQQRWQDACELIRHETERRLVNGAAERFTRCHSEDRSRSGQHTVLRGSDAPPREGRARSVPPVTSGVSGSDAREAWDGARPSSWKASDVATARVYKTGAQVGAAVAAARQRGAVALLRTPHGIFRVTPHHLFPHDTSCTEQGGRYLGHTPQQKDVELLATGLLPIIGIGNDDNDDGVVPERRTIIPAPNHQVDTTTQKTRGKGALSEEFNVLEGVRRNTTNVKKSQSTPTHHRTNDDQECGNESTRRTLAIKDRKGETSPMFPFNVKNVEARLDTPKRVLLVRTVGTQANSSKMKLTPKTSSEITSMNSMTEVPDTCSHTSTSEINLVLSKTKDNFASDSKITIASEYVSCIDFSQSFTLLDSEEEKTKQLLPHNSRERSRAQTTDSSTNVNYGEYLAKNQFKKGSTIDLTPITEHSIITDSIRNNSGEKETSSETTFNENALRETREMTTDNTEAPEDIETDRTEKAKKSRLKERELPEAEKSSRKKSVVADERDLYDKDKEVTKSSKSKSIHRAQPELLKLQPNSNLSKSSRRSSPSHHRNPRTLPLEGKKGTSKSLDSTWNVIDTKNLHVNSSPSDFSKMDRSSSILEENKKGRTNSCDCIMKGIDSENSFISASPSRISKVHRSDTERNSSNTKGIKKGRENTSEDKGSDDSPVIKRVSKSQRVSSRATSLEKVTLPPTPPSTSSKTATSTDGRKSLQHSSSTNKSASDTKKSDDKDVSTPSPCKADLSTSDSPGSLKCSEDTTYNLENSLMSSTVLKQSLEIPHSSFPDTEQSNTKSTYYTMSSNMQQSNMESHEFVMCDARPDVKTLMLQNDTPRKSRHYSKRRAHSNPNTSPDTNEISKNGTLCATDKLSRPSMSSTTKSLEKNKAFSKTEKHSCATKEFETDKLPKTRERSSRSAAYKHSSHTKSLIRPSSPNIEKRSKHSNEGKPHSSKKDLSQLPERSNMREDPYQTLSQDTPSRAQRHSHSAQPFSQPTNSNTSVGGVGGSVLGRALDELRPELHRSHHRPRGSRRAESPSRSPVEHDEFCEDVHRPRREPRPSRCRKYASTCSHRRSHSQNASFGAESVSTGITEYKSMPGSSPSSDSSSMMTTSSSPPAVISSREQHERVSQSPLVGTRPQHAVGSSGCSRRAASASVKWEPGSTNESTHPPQGEGPVTSKNIERKGQDLFRRGRQMVWRLTNQSRALRNRLQQRYDLSMSSDGGEENTEKCVSENKSETLSCADNCSFTTGCNTYVLDKQPQKQSDSRKRNAEIEDAHCRSHNESERPETSSPEDDTVRSTTHSSRLSEQSENGNAHICETATPTSRHSEKRESSRKPEDRRTNARNEKGSAPYHSSKDSQSAPPEGRLRSVVHHISTEVRKTLKIVEKISDEAMNKVHTKMEETVENEPEEAENEDSPPQSSARGRSVDRSRPPARLSRARGNSSSSRRSQRPESSESGSVGGWRTAVSTIREKQDGKFQIKGNNRVIMHCGMPTAVPPVWHLPTCKRAGDAWNTEWNLRKSSETQGSRKKGFNKIPHELSDKKGAAKLKNVSGRDVSRSREDAESARFANSVSTRRVNDSNEWESASERPVSHSFPPRSSTRRPHDHSRTRRYNSPDCVAEADENIASLISDSESEENTRFNRIFNLLLQSSRTYTKMECQSDGRTHITSKERRRKKKLKKKNHDHRKNKESGWRHLELSMSAEPKDGMDDATNTMELVSSLPSSLVANESTANREESDSALERQESVRVIMSKHVRCESDSELRDSTSAECHERRSKTHIRRPYFPTRRCVAQRANTSSVRGAIDSRTWHVSRAGRNAQARMADVAKGRSAQRTDDKHKYIQLPTEELSLQHASTLCNRRQSGSNTKSVPQDGNSSYISLSRDDESSLVCKDNVIAIDATKLPECQITNKGSDDLLCDSVRSSEAKYVKNVHHSPNSNRETSSVKQDIKRSCEVEAIPPSNEPSLRVITFPNAIPETSSSQILYMVPKPRPRETYWEVPSSRTLKRRITQKVVQSVLNKLRDIVRSDEVRERLKLEATAAIAVGVPPELKSAKSSLFHKRGHERTSHQCYISDDMDSLSKKLKEYVKRAYEKRSKKPRQLLDQPRSRSKSSPSNVSTSKGTQTRSLVCLHRQNELRVPVLLKDEKQLPSKHNLKMQVSLPASVSAHASTNHSKQTSELKSSGSQICISDETKIPTSKVFNGTITTSCKNSKHTLKTNLRNRSHATYRNVKNKSENITKEYCNKRQSHLRAHKSSREKSKKGSSSVEGISEKDTINSLEYQKNSDMSSNEVTYSNVQKIAKNVKLHYEELSDSFSDQKCFTHNKQYISESQQCDLGSVEDPSLKTNCEIDACDFSSVNKYGNDLSMESAEKESKPDSWSSNYERPHKDVVDAKCGSSSTDLFSEKFSSKSTQHRQDKPSRKMQLEAYKWTLLAQRLSKTFSNYSEISLNNDFDEEDLESTNLLKTEPLKTHDLIDNSSQYSNSFMENLLEEKEENEKENHTVSCSSSKLGKYEQNTCPKRACANISTSTEHISNEIYGRENCQNLVSPLEQTISTGKSLESLGRVTISTGINTEDTSHDCSRSESLHFSAFEKTKLTGDIVPYKGSNKMNPEENYDQESFYCSQNTLASQGANTSWLIDKRLKFDNITGEVSSDMARNKNRDLQHTLKSQIDNKLLARGVLKTGRIDNTDDESGGSSKKTSNTEDRRIIYESTSQEHRSQGKLRMSVSQKILKSENTTDFNNTLRIGKEKPPITSDLQSTKIGPDITYGKFKKTHTYESDGGTGFEKLNTPFVSKETFTKMSDEKDGILKNTCSKETETEFDKIEAGKKQEISCAEKALSTTSLNNIHEISAEGSTNESRYIIHDMVQQDKKIANASSEDRYTTMDVDVLSEIGLEKERAEELCAIESNIIAKQHNVSNDAALSRGTQTEEISRNISRKETKCPESSENNTNKNVHNGFIEKSELNDVKKGEEEGIEQSSQAGCDTKHRKQYLKVFEGGAEVKKFIGVLTFAENDITSTPSTQKDVSSYCSKAIQVDEDNNRNPNDAPTIIRDKSKTVVMDVRISSNVTSQPQSPVVILQSREIKDTASQTISVVSDVLSYKVSNSNIEKQSDSGTNVAVFETKEQEYEELEKNFASRNQSIFNSPQLDQISQEESCKQNRENVWNLSPDALDKESQTELSAMDKRISYTIPFTSQNESFDLGETSTENIFPQDPMQEVNISTTNNVCAEKSSKMISLRILRSSSHLSSVSNKSQATNVLSSRRKKLRKRPKRSYLRSENYSNKELPLSHNSVENQTCKIIPSDSHSLKCRETGQQTSYIGNSTETTIYSLLSDSCKSISEWQTSESRVSGIHSNGKTPRTKRLTKSQSTQWEAPHTTFSENLAGQSSMSKSSDYERDSDSKYHSINSHSTQWRTPTNTSIGLYYSNSPTTISQTMAIPSTNSQESEMGEMNSEAEVSPIKGSSTSHSLEWSLQKSLSGTLCSKFSLSSRSISPKICTPKSGSLEQNLLRRLSTISQPMRRNIKTTVEGVSTLSHTLNTSVGSQSLCFANNSSIPDSLFERSKVVESISSTSPLFQKLTQRSLSLCSRLSGRCPRRNLSSGRTGGFTFKRSSHFEQGSETSWLAQVRYEGNFNRDGRPTTLLTKMTQESKVTRLKKDIKPKKGNHIPRSHTPKGPLLRAKRLSTSQRYQPVSPHLKDEAVYVQEISSSKEEPECDRNEPSPNHRDLEKRSSSQSLKSSSSIRPSSRSPSIRPSSLGQSPLRQPSLNQPVTRSRSYQSTLAQSSIKKSSFVGQNFSERTPIRHLSRSRKRRCASDEGSPIRKTVSMKSSGRESVEHPSRINSTILDPPKEILQNEPPSRDFNQHTKNAAFVSDFSERKTPDQLTHNISGKPFQNKQSLFRQPALKQSATKLPPEREIFVDQQCSLKQRHERQSATRLFPGQNLPIVHKTLKRADDAYSAERQSTDDINSKRISRKTAPERCILRNRSKKGKSHSEASEKVYSSTKYMNATEISKKFPQYYEIPQFTKSKLMRTSSQPDMQKKLTKNVSLGVYQSEKSPPQILSRAPVQINNSSGSKPESSGHETQETMPTHQGIPLDQICRNQEGRQGISDKYTFEPERAGICECHMCSEGEVSVEKFNSPADSKKKEGKAPDSASIILHCSQEEKARSLSNKSLPKELGDFASSQSIGEAILGDQSPLNGNERNQFTDRGFRDVATRSISQESPSAGKYPFNASQSSENAQIVHDKGESPNKGITITALKSHVWEASNICLEEQKKDGPHFSNHNGKQDKLPNTGYEDCSTQMSADCSLGSDTDALARDFCRDVTRKACSASYFRNRSPNASSSSRYSRHSRDDFKLGTIQEGRSLPLEDTVEHSRRMPNSTRQWVEAHFNSNMPPPVRVQSVSTPTILPHRSPRMSLQPSPRALLQCSPHHSPGSSSQASRRTPPRVSPRDWLRTSLPDSPQNPNRNSKQHSVQRSPRSSAQKMTRESSRESTRNSTGTSPKHSPRDSPKRAFRYSPRKSSQNSFQDLPKCPTKQLPHNVAQDLTRDVTQQLPHDVAQYLPHDVAQDLPQDVIGDLTEDVAQCLPHDVAQDLPHDVAQESTGDSTKKSTEDSIQKSTGDYTKKSKEDSIQKSIVDLHKQLIEHCIKKSTEDLTQKSSPDTTQISRQDSTEKTTADTTEKSTPTTTQQTVRASNQKSATDSPRNSPRDSPYESSQDSTQDSTTHSVHDPLQHSVEESKRSSTECSGRDSRILSVCDSQQISVEDSPYGSNRSPNNCIRNPSQDSQWRSRQSSLCDSPRSSLNEPRRSTPYGSPRSSTLDSSKISVKGSSRYSCRSSRGDSPRILTNVSDHNSLRSSLYDSPQVSTHGSPQRSLRDSPPVSTNESSSSSSQSALHESPRVSPDVSSDSLLRTSLRESSRDSTLVLQHETLPQITSPGASASTSFGESLPETFAASPSCVSLQPTSPSLQGASTSVTSMQTHCSHDEAKETPKPRAEGVGDSEVQQQPTSQSLPPPSLPPSPRSPPPQPPLSPPPRYNHSRCLRSRSATISTTVMRSGFRHNSATGCHESYRECYILSPQRLNIVRMTCRVTGERSPASVRSSPHAAARSASADAGDVRLRSAFQLEYRNTSVSWRRERI